MKYKYLTPSPLHLDSQGKYTKRPMVEIEVFGENGRSIRQLALIDSGADITLLNYEIAEFLGVDLSRAIRTTTTGIIGSSSAFLVKRVAIRVEHLNNITVPVVFIKSSNVNVLLGQDGFFDLNRIKFEKDHDTFEITPVRK